LAVGYDHPSTFDESLFSSIFGSEIGDVLGLSRESQELWQYPANTKLGDVVSLFTVGVHRILVDFGQNKVGVLSQSDVVRFIHANQAQLSELYQMTVADIVIPFNKNDDNNNDGKQLITIPVESTAAQGFRKLWQSFNMNIQAAPVVDSSNRIVATLSVSDLRGITKESFKNLLLPVLDFLRTRGELKPPVVCTPKDTLAAVVQKIIQHKIHRVWVVKDEQSLDFVNIVALSDIIKTFAPFRYIPVNSINY